MKLLFLQGADYSVLPTPTTLVTVSCRPYKQMTVEVENKDGSQNLTVQVWRRCSVDGAFSLSPLDLLSDMTPGESRCIDLDVSASVDVRLIGIASGVGLTARVAALGLASRRAGSGI